ncbi:glucosaminidase domain-containing protein, partial [Gordonibacter pamelaeae]|uniref:glucosaminidase domain-containing protein n=2 Tax=Gordonibacter pamelaeae TaxID=471189 RepID=UPI003617FA27
LYVDAVDAYGNKTTKDATVKAIGTNIMGASESNASQMARYYVSKSLPYPSVVYASKGAGDLATFCNIVSEEAAAEGVRADVVFCQAMKETGWLQFTGDVKAEQCNFCGLGATGGGNPGLSFESVRMGVRAHVQHLKAYASTDPLVNDCVDPRFTYVTRGIAPTLEELNGRWAVPGNNYGQDIAAMIKEMQKA